MINYKISYCWMIYVVLFLFFPKGLKAQNQSNSVFDAYRGGNISWLAYQHKYNMLYMSIYNDAVKMLEARKEKISSLSTSEEWVKYRSELKAGIYKGLSGFEKTPLNARITGIIRRETFIVEKVLFESHPGFYVTACFFIPGKRQKPGPVIIYCSGHGEIAFRGKEYQPRIFDLVNKGFMVFAIDPVGQGERLQYVNPETNKSNIGGPTLEHSYAGAQCLLAGHSLTDYFVWDGVRAVDYLLTRKEVDPARIGITGMSGGGTQSSMIAAYDDRIYAAAIECYITSFGRLLESIGPQDAEQNPWHAIKKGFDHADLLHLRAPKPALIVTTTNDFFSIQGARESFEEAKKSYEIFGQPGNIEITEDMGPHGPTKLNSDAICRFFMKHLKPAQPANETRIDQFPEKDLWVTQTGQIATSLNGKTVYDLNLEYIQKNAHTDLNSADLLTDIRRIGGMNFNDSIKSVVYTGKIIKENFIIEKYFISTLKENSVLPFYILYKADAKKRPAVIYISTGGKEDVLNSPEVLNLLDLDYILVCPDLPGTGELSDPVYRGVTIKGVLYNYMFATNLTGKNIPGIQAEALEIIWRHLRERKDIDCDDISAVVKAEMCSGFLHFAVFRNHFRQIVLLNPYTSYHDLALTRYYDPHIMLASVPGALNCYDLPEMESLLAPTALIVINPVRADGTALQPGDTDQHYRKLKDVYSQKGPGKLRFVVTGVDEQDKELIRLF